MKKTLGELVVIGVVSITLAAVVNQTRAKGKIDWTERYFYLQPSGAEVAQPSGDIKPVAGNGGQTTSASLGDTSGGTDSQGGTDAVEQAAEKPSPYQMITLEEVAEIVNDPGWDPYLNVLVDARSESAFSEGHIPGAMRCYHYELSTCIDAVLEKAMGAQRVIVYCNGGQCTDSKYMCDKLINEFGVPYEAVYLFDGGWEEWSDAEMSVETGLEP